MLSKGYYHAINLGIATNFYISIDSFWILDEFVGELRRILVLPSPISTSHIYLIYFCTCLCFNQNGLSNNLYKTNILQRNLFHFFFIFLWNFLPIKGRASVFKCTFRDWLILYHRNILTFTYNAHNIWNFHCKITNKSNNFANELSKLIIF